MDLEFQKVGRDLLTLGLSCTPLPSPAHGWNTRVEVGKAAQMAAELQGSGVGWIPDPTATLPVLHSGEYGTSRGRLVAMKGSHGDRLACGAQRHWISFHEA